MRGKDGLAQQPFISETMCSNFLKKQARSAKCKQVSASMIGTSVITLIDETGKYGNSRYSVVLY